MVSLPDHVAWDRGVHLRSTPLWLDAQGKRPLCFITSLTQTLPPRHQRVATSAELAHSLKALGYKANVLPVPDDRWITLGGQQIHVVPLDDVATGLLVGVAGARVLFTGPLRQEPVDWPRADHVVTSLGPPGHRGTSMGRAHKTLSLFLRQAQADDVAAQIAVDSLHVALSLYDQLSAAGFVLRPQGMLGRLRSLSQGEQTPFGLRLASGRVSPRGRLALVDTGSGARLGRAPDATIRLRYYGDGPALGRLLVDVGARSVTVVGRPSSQSRSVTRYLGAGVEAHFLAPQRQLSL